MAPLTHLDTHVVVWLYLPRLDLLSERATEMLRTGDLRVSPMAVLEVTYLHEIGRLRVNGASVLASLNDQLGLRLDETPFERVVAEAHPMTWTRDPFDRLIAAQANAAGAALVTRDEALRRNVGRAAW